MLRDSMSFPSCVASILVVVVATAGAARAADPATQLATLWPDLFPQASLVSTTVETQVGLRIPAPTEAQAALGLRPDDIIVGVNGIAVGRDELATGDAAPVLTVWREFPGEQPIVDLDEAGQVVLREFTRLPVEERAPMRLAVMLANQGTLIHSGAGVVLIPATNDSEAWLRYANPLPAASETALRSMVRALGGRKQGVAASDREIEKGRTAMNKRDYLTAQDRALKALVLAVEEPPARAEAGRVTAATALYLDAQQRFAEERARLLAPQSRFGFVFEGGADRIAGFLPQETLLTVDGSTAPALAAGVRVRLPTGFESARGRPWLQGVHLLLMYGLTMGQFDSKQVRSDLIVPEGVPVLETTLHRFSAEILYEPTIATRLRPFFRGGVGAYPLRAYEQCPGSQSTQESLAVSSTEVGWLVGGGFDCFRLQDIGLRGSLGATYRFLTYEFAGSAPPAWEDCETQLELRLDDAGYKLDMSGWQLAFMLRYDL